MALPRGLRAVPPVAERQDAGFVRVAEMPGMTGLWVMRRAERE